MSFHVRILIREHAKMIKIILFNCFLVTNLHFCVGYHKGHKEKDVLNEIFSWKQISYDFNGVLYTSSADRRHDDPSTGEVPEAKKFFIQPNNVPIGFEATRDRVFVTVPRRRYGIPSTLNYISQSTRDSSPTLKPYPDVDSVDQLVSVYRPRLDVCDRLWMVDTGLLEVPGARVQVKPPAIVIFDVKTDKLILRHDLDPSVLVNDRTPGGLTSLLVETSKRACDDAYAYINDLATEGLVVFSLKDRASWRVDHPYFRHDEAAMNFTSSGQVLNWRDGLFSLAFGTRNHEKQVFYHPLVSTQEFSISRSALRNSRTTAINPVSLGERGANTQSGSHDYHPPTGVMLYANVAQAGILCWNVEKEVCPANFVLAAQDANRMGYISDLKVRGNHVWFLSNQIPKFVYNTQNIDEFNYFVIKANVYDLTKGTNCE